MIKKAIELGGWKEDKQLYRDKRRNRTNDRFRTQRGNGAADTMSPR